jgi:hypothetical protein
LKRTNQNYSELFGLEYGKRGSVQQQVKQISNDVGWINIDSVRNNLDFGVKYYNPPKTVKYLKKHSFRHSEVELQIKEVCWIHTLSSTPQR